MPVPDALARSRELYGRLQEASPRWLGEIQGALGEAPGVESPMAWRDTRGPRRGPRRPWHHVIFGSNESRVSLPHCAPSVVLARFLGTPGASL